MAKVTVKFIFFAPNVHSGGGFVLLRALLLAWPASVPMTAVLNSRVRQLINVPSGAEITWVNSSVMSRLRIEFQLVKVLKAEDTIFCFHGVPPIFCSAPRVVIFLQNRLYIQAQLPTGYSWKTRLRLVVERLATWALKHRVRQYIVQTPAMHRTVSDWLGTSIAALPHKINMVPFVNPLPSAPACLRVAPVWDFVYVADGVAHKNHSGLLAAWQLLARDGLRPTLAVTLGAKDVAVVRQIEDATALDELRITNLGQISHEDVWALYANARAMIFPSTSESFGLPLVEAAHLGLPIVASEVDFVRDVCVPAQTFDPVSPVSIARAVKRFLGQPDTPLRLNTPEEFWEKVLQGIRPKSGEVLSSSEKVVDDKR